MKRISLALFAVLTLSIAVLAQTTWKYVGNYKPALLKSGAEISAELDKKVAEAGAAGNPGGASVSIIETEDFGVSIRRRNEIPGQQQYAPSHPLSVEVYRILEGSGTLVTGGTLDPPPPAPRPEAPDNIRSERVIGGTAKEVKAGDVLVLPVNSPHWFTKIDGSITYMEIRIRSQWSGTASDR